ncbi:MAG: hypothetical protein QI199_07750 [Candidatus Korarchaeota archaeon]|nr:hypothetical protein [Candidatus Korarchaeota archaeon]
MDLVIDRELTDRGRREVLASAIRKAFFEVTGEGEILALSKIAEILERWDFSKEEFRRTVLSAVYYLKGAKMVRFKSRTSGDYLEIHGILLG